MIGVGQWGHSTDTPSVKPIPHHVYRLPVLHGHASEYNTHFERYSCGAGFPPEQTCCGQLLFYNGFEEKARAVALNYMRVFRKKQRIDCYTFWSKVSMVKHHYPELFPVGPAEHALAVDITAYIFKFTEFFGEPVQDTDVGAFCQHAESDLSSSLSQPA